MTHSIISNRKSIISMMIAASLLMSFPLLTSNLVNKSDLYTADPDQVGNIAQDYWPTNGWLNGTLEEFDMDSTIFQNMLEYIDEENIPMEYMIVIKNGYLVFDHYFHWLFEPHKRLDVYTVARCLNWILWGMALNDGLISNITHPVVDFFPELTIANMTLWKESITVEHLLTYTSGLYYNETSVAYGQPENSYTQMQGSDSWAGYVLNQTVVYEPGTHWNYGGGDSHLLSCIFSKETGMSLYDYAVDSLFDTLNITDVVWSQEETGISNGANGLRMTPHDFAKIGYLLLNNGTWDGVQLYTQDWAEDSRIPRIRIAEEFEYDHETYFGYHRYMDQEYGSFFISPHFNTRNVFVFPEHDLVVIITIGLTTGPYYQDDIVYDHILQSLESATTPTSTSTSTSTMTSNSTTTSSTTSLPTTNGSELIIIAVVGVAIVAIVIVILLVTRVKRS